MDEIVAKISRKASIFFQKKHKMSNNGPLQSPLRHFCINFLTSNFFWANKRPQINIPPQTPISSVQITHWGFNIWEFPKICLILGLAGEGERDMWVIFWVIYLPFLVVGDPEPHPVW